MTKGIIFDIKRYAIHDGPGIRTTVFFKGCPLNCMWCHNPEGKNPEPELLYFSKKCRNSCDLCLEACPEKAISKNTTIRIDDIRCRRCGACADACVYEALEMAGKEMEAGEVVGVIRKDKVFYDESGGGVTFSGGEPLMQPAFLEDVLLRCRSRDIHTAVDTCGYASEEIVERIGQRADLFLYDIKVIDNEKHKRYTGVSNDLILKNLRQLVEMGRRVWVRIPLVAGINDGPEEMARLCSVLSSLKRLDGVSVLPYHRAGTGKEDKIQNKQKTSADEKFTAPSSQRRVEITEKLKKAGLNVKEGG